MELEKDLEQAEVVVNSEVDSTETMVDYREIVSNKEWQE
jgi:hypothetical protein